MQRRGYRSAGREAKARETRGRVLAAATEVFLERGFAGATVREVATRAGVSVPMVELLFGTKGKLLKAAIDAAIAGDDEPVAVLDREWVGAAVANPTAPGFLGVVAEVIGAAQRRSAGLVLALFEGAATNPELGELADQSSEQRATTAAWIVDQLAGRGSLRMGRAEAVDTVWTLMDPAVFERLTRRRGWAVARYERWLADSLGRLLVEDI